MAVGNITPWAIPSGCKLLVALTFSCNMGFVAQVRLHPQPCNSSSCIGAMVFCETVETKACQLTCSSTLQEQTCTIAPSDLNQIQSIQVTMPLGGGTVSWLKITAE